MVGGEPFWRKVPPPPPPEVFDVIESLFAAFSGLRSRRRAFPHDARLMRFLHVTGCMLQKKPVHFVKIYIDFESSNQRKGRRSARSENKAGTDARIRKSLERERGGLEGGGRSLSSERFSLPPPIPSIPCHYSVAASSTISKASITSPTLMSLKFSRLMPHS